MPEENTVRSISSHPIENHFRVIRRYHYFLFFILFLSKLPIFWHFISLIFLTPVINFNCDASKGSSENYCPCENPRWNTSVFKNTIQMKYGLHCDRQWLVTLTQCFVYIGSLFGSYAFGRWSDKWGRRSATVYSCLLLAVSGCLLSFMPEVNSFLIMRFIEGAACGGYIVTVFVFLVEFCGTNNREIISVLFHIPPNFGHASAAAISYFLRDCDHFQLAISVPLFIFVSIRCLVYESPKWLLDMGRMEEASRVMDKIDEFNKDSSPSIQPELEAYNANMKSKTKFKFMEIFKHRRLTVNFLCMSYIYFVCGSGFYGVSQYIGQMSGDIHKNVAISGLLLVPGTVSAVFLIKWLSRRLFLMITSLVSGIFIIIVVLINDELSLLKVIFACICNCGFYLSFLIAFLYGVELFPTSIRSSALGTLSTISRVGQIVAPQINALSPFVAALTFGIMAIIGTALCIPLPETKNVDLPSTVEDTKRKDPKRLSQETGATSSK